MHYMTKLCLILFLLHFHCPSGKSAILKNVKQQAEDVDLNIQDETAVFNGEKFPNNEPEVPRLLKVRRRSTRKKSARSVQQIPPDASVFDPTAIPFVIVMDEDTPDEPRAPSGILTGNGTGKNGTLGQGNIPKVEFRASGGGGVLSNPTDCYYPLLDLTTGTGPNNKLKLKYQYNDKPPCPVPEPEEDEPIPYHTYKGTKGYGEECRLHYEVNDEQIKGYSDAGGYQTTPNIYDRNIAGSPDNTLDRKWALVDEYTCRKADFLECYPTSPDYVNDEGNFVGGKGTCKCMAAFGRDVDSRLVIDNKCYVPAGLGRHSECITQDHGSPLPSGDSLYEPKTWNPIKLPCTPNSDCVEHQYWIEKRCKCKKYSVLDATRGTCTDVNGGYAVSKSGLLIASSLIALVLQQM